MRNGSWYRNPYKTSNWYTKSGIMWCALKCVRDKWIHVERCWGVMASKIYTAAFRIMTICDMVTGAISVIPNDSIFISRLKESNRDTQGCWWVLSPTRKETSYSDRRFWVSYTLFIIIIGGILVLFIYITRLASNEIFSGVLISP